MNEKEMTTFVYEYLKKSAKHYCIQYRHKIDLDDFESEFMYYFAKNEQKIYEILAKNEVEFYKFMKVKLKYLAESYAKGVVLERTHYLSGEWSLSAVDSSLKRACPKMLPVLEEVVDAKTYGIVYARYYEKKRRIQVMREFEISEKAYKYALRSAAEKITLKMCRPDYS